jgi:hypothetical protein
MGSRIIVSISNWTQIYQDLKVPNCYVIPSVGLSSFAYKDHSVKRISYGLSQSDSIKQSVDFCDLINVSECDCKIFLYALCDCKMFLNAFCNCKIYLNITW